MDDDKDIDENNEHKSADVLIDTQIESTTIIEDNNTPLEVDNDADVDDKDEKLIEIVSSELDNSDEKIVDDELKTSKESINEISTVSPKDSSKESIAAQFNQIVRLRKTTVPRCRRSAMPSKTTPRFMTQPVMSENPHSIDSDCFGNTEESGSMTNVTSNDSSTTHPARYSRTLSGTTKIKRDLPEQFDTASLLVRKKDSTDGDSRSDRSMGSQDISCSPDNNSNLQNPNNSVFFDENKSNYKSSKSLLEAAKLSNQNSLPGSLRRNIPQHIRIHSDEVKQPPPDNAASIADVTSDYLSRKISKGSDKNKDLDFSVLTTSVGAPRISPFRYGAGVDIGSPFDSVVMKSPSAQALMKSNISRNRVAAGLQHKLSGASLLSNPSNSKEHLEEFDFDEKPEENINDKATEESEKVDNSAAIQDQNAKLEKRYMITQELIHVESEYVKVLEILVNHYMIPMKLEKLVDDSQVDIIFNKCNDLMVNHAAFLGTLQSLEMDDTIGDKMLEMFSRTSVQECYMSFIEHFAMSEKMLDTISSKSQVMRFLEQKQKECKNKLPLKGLIVQPVQRIPRYELLIKRLIDNTPQNSIDYDLLLDAQCAIHQVALKINAVKESMSSDDSEGNKLLERLLQPMTLSQARQFIRHDIVNVEDRKDGYVVFLFSDQIILTTVKRRGTGTNKKPSVLKLQTINGPDFVDNVKYKFVMRINIENIEFESNEDTDQKFIQRNKILKDKKDLTILEEIEGLLCKLDRKHSDIDVCINKLYMSIIQDMEDAKNSKSVTSSNNSATCSFIVTSKEGLEKMDLTFNSIEKKQSWEKTLMELKNKLVDVPRTPKFNLSLSVTRTQSGMQFCCASPIEGYNNSGIRDIWICQSDGFTGHLCLLSMQSDPIVTMNNPLPACNAKVMCIIAVPGYTGTVRSRSSLSLDNRFLGGVSNVLKKRSKGDGSRLDIPLEIPREDAEGDGDNDVQIQTKIQQDDSSSPSCSDSENEEIDDNGNVDENQKAKKMNDPYKATIWIGLEDGTILVFYSAENVRMTKSKRKIELGSTVISMLHFDNHIYVSLLNGEIVAFKRHIEGYWDFDYPNITKITTQSNPIKNLLAVTGYIWGTSGRNIMIINPTSIKIENTFSLSEGSDQRPISLIACSGQCVWLTQENSSRILLYHATSYEFLYEINIRPNVLQNLQVWDDIIIRHKEACLRITCLLVCKDLLWVGTSSGLILTVMIPNVTTSTNKSSIFQIKVETLDKGHTGPVRFLVSLENSQKPHPSLRRQSLSPCTTMATQMKVICGGEGMEDFGSMMHKTSRDNSSVSTNNSELGKDDATNHILIWDIQ